MSVDIGNLDKEVSDNLGNLMIQEISYRLRTSLLVVSEQDCQLLATAEVNRIAFRQRNKIPDGGPTTVADRAWFQIADGIWNNNAELSANITKQRYSEIMATALIEGVQAALELDAGQQDKTAQAPAERDFHTVLQNIIKEVPTDKTDFLRDLEWVRNGASFRAPEMRMEDWGNLQMMFVRHLGEPPLADEWKIKVLSIFMDKTVEETQATFGVK